MKTMTSSLAVALALGLVTAADANDWTGPFLTFGVSSSVADFSTTSSDTFISRDMMGDIAPYAALGHDWSVGNVTFGVLVDVDGGNITEDLISEGKGTLGEADMFATLRGRIGVPVNDQIQVYASAGLAMMRMGSILVAPVEDGLTSEKKNMKGAVIGLGMDYALSPGRNISIEFIHADFGKGTFHEDFLTRDPVVQSLRVGYTFRF